MKFIFSPDATGTDPRRTQLGSPDDTEKTLRAVRRIVRALALSSRDLARRHNLTPAQLLCLRLLKDGAALPAGTIAHALSFSPQTVTGLIDRLEARGLAARVRCETDRRQVLVSLTQHGQTTVATLAPSLQERFVARFDALPPTRRRVLRRSIEAIVTMLEADALEAAPLLAHDHSLNPQDAKEAKSGACVPASEKKPKAHHLHTTSRKH